VGYKVVKMGYRWNVGNGKRIRFWEDRWFESCSLAIQFWDIYSIANEQGISLRDDWDGCNLKLTFRRTIDSNTMDLWYEMLQLVISVQFIKEEDDIIWQYISSGKYYVQSLYAVVNKRGETYLYPPLMWKLKIPSYFPMTFR
jgi:hypothetical protein